MRDVTWRPREAANKPRKRLRQALLLVLLVSANVGVVLYHGDPRAAVPPDRTAVEPAEAAGAAGTAEGVAAVVDAGPVEAYDPAFGLRAPGPVHRVEVVRLGRGQNAASALTEAGVLDADIAGALGSLTELVDFRRLRPGHTFKVRLDREGNLISLDVIRGLLDQTRTERRDQGWQAVRIEVRVDEMVAEVSGQVTASLWTSLVDEAGERPDLVHSVVEVFAWEIDFYSQVFPGDTFKVLVTKRFAEGEFVGYGDLLAAELVSGGTVHRAFIHYPPATDAKVAPPVYCNAAGESMRKQLLKAPLKYGPVTSGFGNRRHPILGFNRKHNGIDYGVPSGTAVWSVGDGRVMRAGWNGGYGRFIEIRHANGWASAYGHLSKINVRAGQRVFQKDVIGAVGNTGFSTGPHLHYELRLTGKPVNPATQKFEPGKALKGDELAAFRERVAELSARLDRMSFNLALVGKP